jgi:XTP/dITP diphosphohydrolase
MKLIFATGNQHKVDEIQSAIGEELQIISLKQAHIDIEIPEPHETLEENASEKSMTVYTLTGSNCFSEDTGLEVDALQGAPGVRSARYAGDEKSFDKNIDRLLSELARESNRHAQFRTVISLILDGEEWLFEGVCRGQITRQKRGSGGFGYDSVFVPTGAEKTFGEMSMEEKNKYSHRKKAAEQLIAFLKKKFNSGIS